MTAKPWFTLTLLTVLLILLLSFWQISANDSSSTRFFFSSPADILSALQKSATSTQGWRDFAASAYATVSGIGLGLVLGCAVALCALAWPAVGSSIRSAIFLLSALPILAVAPMFLIWFGTGLTLKVALATILAGLVFAARATEMKDAIGIELTEFLSSNYISSSVQMRKVVLPIGVQWVLAAFPSGANAAFLGVFVGEFIAADRGIGYRILRSGALYQIDVVLAQTVLAMILLGAIHLIVQLLRTVISEGITAISLDPIYLRLGRDIPHGSDNESATQ